MKQPHNYKNFHANKLYRNTKRQFVLEFNCGVKHDSQSHIERAIVLFSTHHFIEAIKRV